MESNAFSKPIHIRSPGLLFVSQYNGLLYRNQVLSPIYLSFKKTVWDFEIMEVRTDFILFAIIADANL